MVNILILLAISLSPTIVRCEEEQQQQQQQDGGGSGSIASSTDDVKVRIKLESSDLSS